MELQLLPTIAALVLSTVLFAAFKIYCYVKKQSILLMYKIYAAHVLELYERAIIDEPTSVMYIDNLIPIHELKFKFSYKMVDFFFDCTLFEESSDKIKDLYVVKE